MDQIASALLGSMSSDTAITTLPHCACSEAAACRPRHISVCGAVLSDCRKMTLRIFVKALHDNAFEALDVEYLAQGVKVEGLICNFLRVELSLGVT